MATKKTALGPTIYRALHHKNLHIGFGAGKDKFSVKFNDGFAAVTDGRKISVMDNDPRLGTSYIAIPKPQEKETHGQALVQATLSDELIGAAKGAGDVKQLKAVQVSLDTDRKKLTKAQASKVQLFIDEREEYLEKLAVKPAA